MSIERQSGSVTLELAVNYGVTGPILRAIGLKYAPTKVDGYSVYTELDFDIPIGKGAMGTVGDCWDRTYVRMQECLESLKIIDQCLIKLNHELKRDKEFNPRALVPKKIRPKAGDYYVRAENPKGTWLFFRTDGRSDIPLTLQSKRRFIRESISSSGIK